jgi:ACR3 family arsenite efflux pump ArsB
MVKLFMDLFTDPHLRDARAGLAVALATVVSIFGAQSRLYGLAVFGALFALTVMWGSVLDRLNAIRDAIRAQGTSDD